MSQLRRFVCTVLLALPFAAPDTARACSCIQIDHGFLIPPGTEIPVNAGGIPWSGSLDYSGGELLPPGKDFFSVERIDGEKPEAVAFDIELIEHELLRPWDVLALVVPREGFEPGGRYRFTHRPWFLKDKEDAEIKAPYRLDVRVSEDAWQAGKADESSVDENAARVAVWKSFRDELQVMASAPCSVRIDAAQVGVELELDETSARWRDALLYVTRVEGEIYRPSSGVCSQTPPGQSWAGRARELLFTRCSSGETWEHPKGDLPAGELEVEMVAWLPGTDQMLRARRLVDLTCAERGDLRSREGLREPIWGIQAGRRLDLIEEADLTLADGTHFVVALYGSDVASDGSDEPRPAHRVVVWKEGPEGRFARLHAESFHHLEFAVMLRHEQPFLAVRAWAPASDEPGDLQSSSLRLFHLQRSSMTPVELEPQEACGAKLPPLTFDPMGWARPGYRIASGGISFEVPIDDGIFVTGSAEIVQGEKGFVLTPVDCH